MRQFTSRGKRLLAVIFLSTPLLGSLRVAQADPSKYPRFAQQTLPDDIVPVFINVEELVDAVKAGAKPMIIDVRTEEEFQEAHILSAQSAPLANFKDFVKNVPRDRLVVLY
ncbi:MAG: rhodanese-like domain-containing protein [Candidatus Binatia bacterium]